jgi:isoleucyl-tRNA synthetase
LSASQWLAPICALLLKRRGCLTSESDKSIYLETFPALPFVWNNPEVAQKFEGLRNIRKVMTGALEVARASKQIGSSLQAHAKIFLDPSLSPFIADVDLAELSITSGVTLENAPLSADAFTLEDVPGVAVAIDLASGEKCARCWKVLPEVKTRDLCHRCEGCGGARVKTLFL